MHSVAGIADRVKGCFCSKFIKISYSVVIAI